MQAADDEHLVKISWSIKGYHAFHIRPPINIDLNIEIENNNRYDENAVLVKIPDLVDLPEHVLNQLPEGSNQRPLRQLAGMSTQCKSIWSCLILSSLLKDRGMERFKAREFEKTLIAIRDHPFLRAACQGFLDYQGILFLIIWLQRAFYMVIWFPDPLFDYLITNFVASLMITTRVLDALLSLCYNWKPKDNDQKLDDYNVQIF